MDTLKTPETLIRVKTGEQREITLEAKGLVSIVVEPQAKLCLLESSVGNDLKLDIDLHRGAQLQHIRLVKPLSEQLAIEHTVRQETESSYQHFFVHNRRGKSDSRIEVTLQGEGASCELKGILLGAQQDKETLTLVVDHAVPNCKSKQQVKTILGGQASSLFEGLIRVQKGADGTDASQSNPNLVLSADAVVQTRPQLEIDADDVKCSHGATVGQLDENAVFYMRSRGVAEPNARAMMTFGFAAELLEQMPIRSVLPDVYKDLALFVRNTLGIQEE